MTIKELIDELKTIEKKYGNAKVIIEGKNSYDRAENPDEVEIFVWEKNQIYLHTPEKETTVHIY